MGIIAHAVKTHSSSGRHSNAQSIEGDRQREWAEPPERQAFPASFRIALPIYRGRRSVVGISIWLRGSKSYRNPMPGPTEAI